MGGPCCFWAAFLKHKKRSTHLCCFEQMLSLMSCCCDDHVVLLSWGVLVVVVSCFLLRALRLRTIYLFLIHSKRRGELFCEQCRFPFTPFHRKLIRYQFVMQTVCTASHPPKSRANKEHCKLMLLDNSSGNPKESGSEGWGSNEWWMNLCAPFSQFASSMRVNLH